MTIEDIKQYIEKQLDENETSCACGNRVTYGESCAYEKCLELLDKLEPKKVYLLEQDDSNGYAHYNGIYTSEYEARKHSIGYDVVEFELNKESDGVIL